jgi:hypothetical protein
MGEGITMTGVIKERSSFNRNRRPQVGDVVKEDDGTFSVVTTVSGLGFITESAATFFTKNYLPLSGFGIQETVYDLLVGEGWKPPDDGEYKIWGDK